MSTNHDVGPEPLPRKRLRRREIHLGRRFITCSCNHRLPLFDPDALKDQFVTVLAVARERHRFRLIAWVLMPEHFHLLLVPTAGLGVGSAMPAILIGIKKTFAQRVLAHWRAASPEMLVPLRDSNDTERFWLPGGGFDRNVRDADELERTITYIHGNPVKRGLVARPTDWKWSSARWHAGERTGELPMDSLDFRSAGPGRVTEP